MKTTRKKAQAQIGTRGRTPTIGELAVRFLTLVVKGRIEEAYQSHVDMRGKHHNPFFPAGFPALQRAMMDDQLQHPAKQLTVQHVLSDGNLVAVHSLLLLRPGGETMAVVHIFRFERRKIVEAWDCAQPLPSTSPNDDGAF